MTKPKEKRIERRFLCTRKWTQAYQLYPVDFEVAGAWWTAQIGHRQSDTHSVLGFKTRFHRDEIYEQFGSTESEAIHKARMPLLKARDTTQEALNKMTDDLMELDRLAQDTLNKLFPSKS